MVATHPLAHIGMLMGMPLVIKKAKGVPAYRCAPFVIAFYKCAKGGAVGRYRFKIADIIQFGTNGFRLNLDAMCREYRRQLLQAHLFW